MSLEAEHEALKLVATQRCFYLFAALLLLLIAIPFLEDTPRGLVTLNVINVMVLIAALASVARSRICLVTGFGDITPVHPVMRMLCMLEQVTGVLYLAILIARLASAYPSPQERT